MLEVFVVSLHGQLNDFQVILDSLTYNILYSEIILCHYNAATVNCYCGLKMTAYS